MDRKIKIFISILIVVVFTPFIVIWFLMSGNPVSRIICRSASENYISENYPKYEIKEVVYNFKDGSYVAKVEKPGSKDIYFNVYYDWKGNLEHDSYTENVLGGHNTAYRMDSEYDRLIEQTLADDKISFSKSIFYSGIKDELLDIEEIGSRNVFPVSLMELDKEYDYNDLGYVYGHIVLYAEDEDVSITRAGEILLEVKQTLAEENLGFYTIDFNLNKPKKENQPYYGERINIRAFRYEDIYEEGFEERIKIAHNQLEMYHMEQDKLNGVTDEYYFK